MATIYTINKGINKPLEFKGFKAQYILYLGVGLVGLLVLFAVMYIAGVPVYLCLGITFSAGFLLITRLYKLSHKYGEHGLMKRAARLQVPPAIRNRSRKLFLSLSN